MRINRFVALATGLSRRAADKLADKGEILINGRPIRAGYEIKPTDHVTWHDRPLQLPAKIQTIMLNKPTGYVVSRAGQHNKTIYDLLPPELHNLKPVGRLDKDSSGLLLLTNDGDLAHKLTHPSFQKVKTYEIVLNKPLTSEHWQDITHQGVTLDDGPSHFELTRDDKNDYYNWIVIMREGRNRQIRRTFAALGYDVTKLHRTQFGNFSLGNLAPSSFKKVS